MSEKEKEKEHENTTLDLTKTIEIVGNRKTKAKMQQLKDGKDTKELERLKKLYDSSLTSGLSYYLYGAKTIYDCIGKPQVIQPEKHKGIIYRMHLYRTLDQYPDARLTKRNGQTQKNQDCIRNMMNHAREHGVKVILCIDEKCPFCL